MASMLILVSLFIPRFTAVHRIQAISRSDEGPVPGHDDNTVLNSVCIFQSLCRDTFFFPQALHLGTYFKVCILEPSATVVRMSGPERVKGFLLERYRVSGP